MGEKRNTYVIGGKARGKETTRKTKTWVGNYRVASQLVASSVVISSIELVS
jgi:hypothetical protein